MTRMLHSAKFWTMIVDLIVSLTTYFLTKYLAPEASKDVLFVLGAVQPVILTVIAAWAYEDGKVTTANGHMAVAKLYAPEPREEE